MTTTRTPSPLGQLTKAELEFLRKAIARRQVPTPLTQVATPSRFAELVTDFADDVLRRARSS